MEKNELIASLAKEFKLGCRNNLEMLLISYDKGGSVFSEIIEYPSKGEDAWQPFKSELYRPGLK